MRQNAALQKGVELKHVLAAVAAAWVVRMLRLRNPAPGAPQVR